MITKMHFWTWKTEEVKDLLEWMSIYNQDSLMAYKDVLVAASSEKEFQLHARILKLVSQVSEVKYYFQNQVSSINYRDKYMAENTAWLLDYFDNEKVILWAHNGHISNMEYGVTGTMGNYLSYQLRDQYAILGFLFSQGSFTAVGMEGENYTGLDKQILDSIPKENSLNALMSYTLEPAFFIDLDVLRNYLGWYNAFEKGMEYFQMGAVYNNNPEDYYTTFDPLWFNYMIYFDKSTATDLLK